MIRDRTCQSITLRFRLILAMYYTNETNSKVVYKLQINAYYVKI
jgi:hypothetical protein